MRLTDSKIRSLKPQESRFIEWESGGTGLGLRVFPSGKRSFVFMYRFQGKARMMTIGPYPNISLASARVQVANAKKLLLEGTDPGEKHIVQKKVERESYTVKMLADEFIEKWSKPRKKTWAEDERCLGKDVLPFVGRKKAKDIRRRDIIMILDKILERGSPGMANRAMNILTKMFNFAVSRDIINGSPCVALSLPAKKNQKDRVLDQQEIKTFWECLEHSGISETCQLALKLILITAQRRGEVVGAEWKEINTQERWWNIPAEKSKNDLSHRVPLTKMALNILERIKELSGESNYLFPSPRTGTHIDPRAITRALRGALSKDGKLSSMEPYTPHDLRRTAATMMASSGVPRLTISKILNHSEAGVTAVYDRHGYDNEKRQALETWGRKLQSIISGKPTGKVINLK